MINESLSDAPEELIQQLNAKGKKSKKASSFGGENPRSHDHPLSTDGAPFGEGRRKNKLLRVAGCLESLKDVRGEYLPLEEVRTSTEAFDEMYCDPPLHTDDPDDFEDLMKSVQKWRKEKLEEENSTNGESGPDKEIIFRTAREIAEETPEEVNWIIRPWVARGAITEIDGYLKHSGKTTYTLAMVEAAVKGIPFMEEPTQKTKVVVLTEQNPTSFRRALRDARLLDSDDVGFGFDPLPRTDQS